MSYLGLDIGTTGCKAAVFDGQGNRQAAAYREYPLLAPQPGWAELDPKVVLNACLAVIKEAAAGAGGKILGLGVSCQGEAFTPVAADGAYLGNAMVSSDSRAAGLVGPWSREFGVEKLYEITGHTAHPMFSLFKLLWLRRQAPDVWGRIGKILCFEDLLGWRLGLNPAMGWPLAGRTMLFDIRQHCWSAPILAAAGLDAGQFARPLPSGSAAGTIPRDVAAGLGLPADVVVATGGHDQPCGALGAGAARPGCSIYATGTVECMCPGFDAPVMSPALMRNNLCAYDHAMPGMYASVAFSLTGGNLLKWFRDEFCALEQARARADGSNVYALILEGMSDQPSALQVLPYFTPSGTPYFDAQAEGAVLGLQLSTRRGEILRALLEGVALEMRLNLDLLEQSGMPVRELRAIGGGARSRVWTQLKADVLDKPITPVAETEAGCLGAAILACAARTGASPAALAAGWVRPLAAVAPDPARAEFYARKFESYKLLYPALKALRAGRS